MVSFKFSINFNPLNSKLNAFINLFKDVFTNKKYVYQI